MQPSKQCRCCLCVGETHSRGQHHRERSRSRAHGSDRSRLLEVKAERSEAVSKRGRLRSEPDKAPHKPEPAQPTVPAAHADADVGRAVPAEGLPEQAAGEAPAAVAPQTGVAQVQEVVESGDAGSTPMLACTEKLTPVPEGAPAAEPALEEAAVVRLPASAAAAEPNEAAPAAAASGAGLRIGASSGEPGDAAEQLQASTCAPTARQHELTPSTAGPQSQPKLAPGKVPSLQRKPRSKSAKARAQPCAPAPVAARGGLLQEREARSPRGSSQQPAAQEAPAPPCGRGAVTAVEAAPLPSRDGAASPQEDARDRPGAGTAVARGAAGEAQQAAGQAQLRGLLGKVPGEAGGGDSGAGAGSAPEQAGPLCAEQEAAASHRGGAGEAEASAAVVAPAAEGGRACNGPAGAAECAEHGECEMGTCGVCVVRTASLTGSPAVNGCVNEKHRLWAPGAAQAQ